MVSRYAIWGGGRGDESVHPASTPVRFALVTFVVTLESLMLTGYCSIFINFQLNLLCGFFWGCPPSWLGTSKPIHNCHTLNKSNKCNTINTFVKLLFIIWYITSNFIPHGTQVLLYFVKSPRSASYSSKLSYCLLMTIMVPTWYPHVSTLM